MRLRVSESGRCERLFFHFVPPFPPFPFSLRNISPVETARSNKKDSASGIYGPQEKKNVPLSGIPSSLVTGSHPFSPRASLEVKQVSMSPAVYNLLAVLK